MAMAVADMEHEQEASAMKLVSDRVYYTNTGQDYRTDVFTISCMIQPCSTFLCQHSHSLIGGQMQEDEMGAAVAEMEEDQAASVMKLVSVSTADREKAVHARCQVRAPINYPTRCLQSHFAEVNSPTNLLTYPLLLLI